MPQPVSLRTERPKLQRPGTRFNTGDQMPVTEFERPDPLAGDFIMDATARLLAPRRSVRMTPVVSQPEPKQDKHSAKRRKRKKKSADAPKQEAVKKQPKQSLKETANKGAEKKSAAKKAQPPKAEQVQGKTAKRKERPHREAQQPNRSRTKDSTQQKSLMKPYYLSDDR
jgi:ATP-dependent RNA helicase RhlE